ncbi:josephin [Prochlorococcus sp. MIT 1223]|uniref:josephin n=1 Tax=Prochlorococcus sp. MIT 1223 TaxID=3096217 RepID=UPI002A751492|nr:josephin [Prochlorococcus sp. MIT 1223]
MLYLVNGEKLGEKFWKIGFTHLEDPLKLDKKHFLECYRKEKVTSICAKEISNTISLNITNLIKDCELDGFILNKPSRGFSYDIPLDVLQEIFDFWFNLYKDKFLWSKCLGLLKCRGELNFQKTSFSKGLIGSSAELERQIDQLHKFRPILSNDSIFKIDPMW